MDGAALVRAMFDAAAAAVQPDIAVPKYLPPPPKGRTVVVGAGKAAASMALAAEKTWPKDKPLSGLVITRYGDGEAFKERDGAGLFAVSRARRFSSSGVNRSA